MKNMFTNIDLNVSDNISDVIITGLRNNIINQFKLYFDDDKEKVIVNVDDNNIYHIDVIYVGSVSLFRFAVIFEDNTDNIKQFICKQSYLDSDSNENSILTMLHILNILYKKYDLICYEIIQKYDSDWSRRKYVYVNNMNFPDISDKLLKNLPIIKKENNNETYTKLKIKLNSYGN